LPAVGYTDPCFIVGSLDPEEEDDITEDIKNIELTNFTIGSPSNKFRAGIGFWNNEYARWVFNNINVHDINFYVNGWFCVDIGRGADFFVYNNNIFDYNGNVAIFSDAGGTAYIFNNKFYNARNGIMISLSSWNYPGVPFYVFHNTIYFSNESTTGIGINISSNGAVVKNNHIFNCRYRGVWIVNAYPYPGGVLFEGNFIHMYTGEYAVYILDTRYTRVVNNFIIGATNVYGIYTVNFNRSLAIGNHIYNCAYGIYFYASNSTSLIANHIINCTYGLYVFYCNDVYIRLNWLRNNQYPYIEILSTVFKAASTTNDNMI
jgi:parallel beta-helix repeat protein